MRASAAFRDGIRRVNGAPVVLAGMFAVTLLVALPLSIVLRGLIEAHLGASLAADTAASSVNYDWWQVFSSQASGLGTTFVPSIIGFGAVLDNVSSFMDNIRAASTVAGATAAWLVIWSFLSGGVLDRYARQRPARAHGFFAACGVHFWRFLRLGVVAWVVYVVLFRYVHGWILGDAYWRLTRDLTVERSAFGIRVAGYAVFGALLVLSNVIFDYARIRIVVEDRRSAAAALVAGARFAIRHARGVLALYALNAAAFLVLVGAYAVMAPGPGRGTWILVAVGEGYILARHYLKLLFYASETAFFQGALAHATYTAAPALVWPDSPAVESITSADPGVAH